MTEEQVFKINKAFCVLVKLMEEYSFRTMFTPKMIGLQVRNYQFDRLLEENCPKVYKHLCDLDVRSTMYASQWFMTIFAYRFPLELVFRIYDIIFAQGEESILRFAIALMKSNQETILSLDFEQAIEYLKDGLFDKYLEKVTDLVTDSSKINISQRKLKKWKSDFLEQLRFQEPDFIECERLRLENRGLLQTLEDKDKYFDALTKDHVDMVNKFIIAKHETENQREKIIQMETLVDSLKKVIKDERDVVENEFRGELDCLKEKNELLIQEKSQLEDYCWDLEERLRIARSKS
jgi:hypothetical protein